MTKKFTLDDIRDAAEAKYGSTYITIGDADVELVNLLRLPKDKRKVLLELGKEAEKAEGEKKDDFDIDETRESLKEALRAACRTEEQGQRLSDALGDDTALVMQAFSFYTKETQAGEASPSQD